MGLENDLRKTTSKMPNFSPSIASVHMVALLRKSKSVEHEAFALLIEANDKQEQHLEFITVEMKDLAKVHNIAAEHLIDVSNRLAVVEKRTLVQDVQTKEYKRLGVWLIAGVTYLIGTFVSQTIAQWFNRP